MTLKFHLYYFEYEGLELISYYEILKLPFLGIQFAHRFQLDKLHLARYFHKLLFQ